MFPTFSSPVNFAMKKTDGHKLLLVFNVGGIFGWMKHKNIKDMCEMSFLNTEILI